MVMKEDVTKTYLGILEKILEVKEGELASKLDERMIEDLGMTSMQIFPLIGELVDQFDIDIDYAEFLNNVHTINEGVDLVMKQLDN